MHLNLASHLTARITLDFNRCIVNAASIAREQVRAPSFRFTIE